MNLEFLERKDFWSGVMLIVIGGGSLFIARNYQFGSSLRMGPGYFPIVLGAALVMFGVYFAIQGLRARRREARGLVVAARADRPAAVARPVRPPDRPRRLHPGDARA